MIRAYLSAASLFAFASLCAGLIGCRAVNEPSAAPPIPTREAAALDDSGGYWTGWRGAAKHGVADDANVAERWTATEGVRWRTDVPGKGNSSPVVWGDRVFLTALVEEDASRELLVLCFRRSDGSLLWQESVGKPLGATHSRNGHASATPAVDRRHVYAAFGARGLHCFSHEGEPIWSAPVPNVEHEWGSAASPVLYGKLVIQLCDSRRHAFLAAYDRDTGDEIWLTPRESNGCWSTPVVVTAVSAGGERDELIVNGTGARGGSRGKVIAYNPQTGAELWHVRGTSDIPCPTAIVADGLVFSTSGGNGPVMAIRPGGTGDVSKSHVVWRRASGGPYVPTGVADGGRLYTITDSGTLRCDSAADGGEIWKRRLRGTFTASLIAAGGRIYATSDQGHVHVLAAGGEYKSLAVNAMNQACFATPAIVEGEILLRTDRSLFCIARESLTLAKEAETTRDATGAAIAGGAAASPSDAAANSESPVAAKRQVNGDETKANKPRKDKTPDRKPPGGSPRGTSL